MKKKLLALVGLATTLSASANVVFPFIVLQKRIDTTFSPYLLIGSLVAIECIVFMLILPHESRVKIVIATVAMNMVSSGFGLLTYVFGETLPQILVYLSLPGLALHAFSDFLLSVVTTIGHNTWSILSTFYGLWFVVSTGFINTLLEYPIALLFLGKTHAKKVLIAVFILNLASAALGVIGIALLRQ